MDGYLSQDDATWRTKNLGNHRAWKICLLALIVWQAWMTTTLFGGPEFWKQLFDDRPISSGSHPLHLYHGYLGAQSLLHRGTPCCFDPFFQAGYPKTPVFDSASRPAELFLTIAGGSYRPAVYKCGIAICCLAVPFLMLIAARNSNLGPGPACAAVAVGLMLWWGIPCRNALEEGNVDVLISGLSSLAFLCQLLHFHYVPRLRYWMSLVGIGSLACFADPLLFLLLFPLVLVFYVSVGPRHHFGWHFALLATLLLAVLANSFWLFDWAESWWLRLPLQLENTSLSHRTLYAFWSAPLWGEPADRAFAVALVGIAAIGVVLLNQNNQRPTARMFGGGAGFFLTLVVIGIAWEPLGRLGTDQLFVPALWLAVIPAVHALVHAYAQAGRIYSSRWAGPVMAGCLVATAAISGPGTTATLAGRCAGTTPLEVGLNPERQALVDLIRNKTTTESRVLWQERHPARGASCWSALLPIITGRSFIGGLGPEMCIEHAYPSLIEDTLAGRPIDDWSDADLEEFCQQYNVGWAICWSPKVIDRFRAWKVAKELSPVNDGGSGALFSLGRRSFILRGHARLVHADCECIILADLVPDDGNVVLSMHYQAGMSASPGRVQIEREPDSHDPIPFIRLKVHAPVARVTLMLGRR